MSRVLHDKLRTATRGRRATLACRWQFLPAVLALWGCRAESAFREPDPDLNRMLEVPRYDSYEEGDFFPDRMVLRHPPAGAVPYDAETGDAAYLEGIEAGAFVGTFPLRLSRDLILRGQSRFEQTCAACHGVSGYGNPMVTKHMQRPAPSLHQPRLRGLPPGKLYYIVSHGYGLMPSYAAHLNVHDRWAVVAYVKALQRSQNAQIAALPSELRQQAERRLR